MKDINKILDRVSEKAKAIREAKSLNDLDLTSEVKKSILSVVKWSKESHSKFPAKGMRGVQDYLGLALSKLHPSDRSLIIDKVSSSYEKIMEKHIKAALKEWGEEVKKDLK